MQRDDVRVRQPAHGLGLALEAGRVFLGHGLVEQMALQDGLDGHRAVQPRVEPFIDHAHRAATQNANDLVATQVGEAARADVH